MRAWRSGAQLLRERLDGQAPVARRALAAAPAAGEGPVPEYVADRLAELRLLHHLPFDHLVPDPALLPPESLRFFALDTAWTDALAEGALSVGVSSAAELAHHERTALAGRAAAAPRVAIVRDRMRGRAVDAAGAEPPAGPVTGLLLRSLAVSQFPGIQVRAYSGVIPADQDPDTVAGAVKLRLLRLSQVAPSVLLALFDGVPSLVVLEEPHTSVQLGLIAKSGGGYSLALRGSDGKAIEEGNAAVTIDVPLRQGSESLGVIDVAALAARIDAEAQKRSQIPRPVGAAVLALELIRAPWRQRFGSPKNV
jgi:hypothetical protein